MTRLRLFASLAVLIAAFAVPTSVFAHPSSQGNGYCKFPDGTLTPGHCSAADHANGGHDTHLPSTPTVSPPSSGPGGGPPSGSPPGGNPPNGNPPNGNTPGGNTPGGNTPGAGLPDMNFNEANCFIRHAATPAQICPVEGGMQYWFIGADGSAQPGPYLPDSPRIERYEGTNPLTGKQVVIDYVTEGDKTLLRVSTYYPDTEYDTNKPYIFTLDPGHTVRYISW